MKFILALLFSFTPTFAQFDMTTTIPSESGTTIGIPRGNAFPQQQMQDPTNPTGGALGGATTSSPGIVPGTGIAPNTGVDMNRGTINPGNVTLPPPPASPALPILPLAPPSPPFPVP